MNSYTLAKRGGAKAWACAAGLLLVASLGAGCSRTVVEAPPPVQTEIVTVAPGPDYVWIGGYWDWSWGHYVWVGGHWDRPDRPHGVWVEPRWEHHGDRYVMIKGYWR